VNAPSISVVHGFAVFDGAFSLFLRRLRKRSLNAALYRYPSVGLPLARIVDGLASHLESERPQGIIAHSLGCAATLLAIGKTSWTGPIVLLAPPMRTLPLTRLIPTFLRWPFAPLLDHRSLTSRLGTSRLGTSEFVTELSAPPSCQVMTIAGRLDLSVPLSCTRLIGAKETRTLWHTHNSLLLSPAVANSCANWMMNHSDA
jgi:hypothetical protein